MMTMNKAVRLSEESVINALYAVDAMKDLDQEEQKKRLEALFKLAGNNDYQRAFVTYIGIKLGFKYDI